MYHVQSSSEFGCVFCLTALVVKPLTNIQWRSTVSVCSSKSFLEDRDHEEQGWLLCSVMIVGAALTEENV